MKKNTFLNILIVSFSLTISGCVTTFQPQTLTCSNFLGGTSVTDTNLRKESRYFSVLPPSGSNWCVKHQSANQIYFITGKHVGKFVETYPSHEERLPFYLAVGYNVKVEGRDLSTPEKISTFMKDWFKEGAGWLPVDGQWVALLPYPKKYKKQLELTQFDLNEDGTFDHDCMRYKASWLDADNSAFPWALVHQEEGFACRHPEKQDLLVVIKYHEVHQRGKENAAFASRQREEAKQTIMSLEMIAE